MYICATPAKIQSTQKSLLFFRYFYKFVPFIQNLSRYSFNCRTSQIEHKEYLGCTWSNDLNVTIDDITWAKIWQFAKETSICNRTRETQFRILHCVQITPPSSDTGWIQVWLKWAPNVKSWVLNLRLCPPLILKASIREDCLIYYYTIILFAAWKNVLLRLLDNTPPTIAYNCTNWYLR